MKKETEVEMGEKMQNKNLKNQPIYQAQEKHSLDIH